MGFFRNAGRKLLETAKITLFRILPREAQIRQVSGEINNGVLKEYGTMTKLEIDNGKRTINFELDLKGEKEAIQIRLSNYLLIQEEGKNPIIVANNIDISREWLNVLVNTLVKENVIPVRIEVKDPLQQAVIRSIL
jgi:hypothetical protein